MSNTSPLAILEHSEAAPEWATSPDRVPLFSVTRQIENPNYDRILADGEDAEPKTIEQLVTYSMPAKPNPGLSLVYLKQARKVNPDVAMSWLIETAVGEEGYDALTEELAGMEPTAAVEFLQKLTGRIQTVAMGGLEAPKGK